ncbi:MerR family transcriptional regulator [Microbispora cellulosiformans]|uniref:MerR family transcriptional regulator n=1 Tax=Microbispora cellulosiformans TaxID=2614688 RepID=A0A5J5K0A6_9ACTN|nr:MerR family transcriptional regulator [Microbispora cellulosiformans]KAA9377653.1 MerR family transcriptional regulator [Microbispora cellulosiformans]
MEHSISEVARVSGLTPRTLRHYDDIGLLRPARTAGNGYRWYGRRELLRLQRILLLRELGVPLARIGEILDGERDEVAALRRHREELAARRDHIEEVIATVDRTIADLTGQAHLSEEEFFSGLTARREALRRDLEARYGPGVGEHFAAAAEETGRWTRQEHEQAAAQGRRLLRRLSRARAGGLAPGSAAVLNLMADHYRAVRLLWPADAAAYHALADVVTADPGQRAMIEDVDPLLPPWLADAIRAYATHRLGHLPPAAPAVRPRAGASAHGEGATR